MRQVDHGTVWLGGLPERLEYEPGKVFDRTLLAPTRDNQSEYFAAIRQQYVYGPRAEFGALGARFIPNTSGHLLIQVVASAQQNSESLGAGLEENYAEAILHEVEYATPLLKDFGAGILRFDHALQHPVDSDEAIFRILARALVSILPLTQPSDVTLNALINQARQSVQREIAEAANIKHSH